MPTYTWIEKGIGAMRAEAGFFGEVPVPDVGSVVTTACWWKFSNRGFSVKALLHIGYVTGGRSNPPPKLANHTVGLATKLTITGHNQQIVGTVARGTYTLYGENHGRRSYILWNFIDFACVALEFH